jgi:hypothetical protein
MSRSNIIMARLTVLIDFDAFITFCNVDFRVMLLVVGLKIGWLVNLMLDSAFKLVSDSVSDSASDSAFDSAFDSEISLIIGLVISEIVGPVASSVLLKVTFRFIRTALLIKFYNLNMVMASYSNSHSFSDRGAILFSVLAYDLSAYTAHPKVLICL